MTVQKIKLACYGGKFEEITAKVYGSFAIHRNLDSRWNRCYTVTHVPTGLGMQFDSAMSGLEGLTLAQIKAKALEFITTASGKDYSNKDLSDNQIYELRVIHTAITRGVTEEEAAGYLRWMKTEIDRFVKKDSW
jgi:hypothetical protein